MKALLLILIAAISTPSLAMDYEDTLVVIAAEKITEDIGQSPFYETLPESTKQLLLDVKQLADQIGTPSTDEQLILLKAALQKIESSQ